MPLLLLLSSCSEKLLQDVYGYWAAKRKRWGKPILRRLQAPTIASDTNPYNTFRCAGDPPLDTSLERRGFEGTVVACML